MLPLLRLAASVVCLAICVCLIAFWSRSFSWWERTEYLAQEERPNEIAVISYGLYSGSGHIQLARQEGVSITGRDDLIESHPARPGRTHPMIDGDSFFGEFIVESKPHFRVVIPYWFLCALSGVPGLALYFKRPYQFKLRNVLLGVAMVAIVLTCVRIFTTLRID